MAFSGTKEEAMMAKWCLQRRDREPSTEVTACLDQWEETADTECGEQGKRTQ